ncbi:hypothetical protein I552_6865, partial [Mycobacterium xenopi 3993]
MPPALRELVPHAWDIASLGPGYVERSCDYCQRTCKNDIFRAGFLDQRGKPREEHEHR